MTLVDYIRLILDDLWSNSSPDIMIFPNGLRVILQQHDYNNVLLFSTRKKWLSMIRGCSLDIFNLNTKLQNNYNNKNSQGHELLKISVLINTDFQTWLLAVLQHSHQPIGVLVKRFRPRQNGRKFSYDIFKCIFLNENCCILGKIHWNRVYLTI